MRRARGFTLIEVLVVIVIVGILLSLGVPAWQRYIANAKIRATSSAFLAGVQTARTEAVRRNVSVDFVLTDAAVLDAAATASATGRGWVIRTGDGVTFIEGRSLDEGGGGSATSVMVNDVNNDGAADANAVSLITFTGLGTAALPGTATVTFTNPSGGACAPAGPMRCLNVTVSRGGQAKLCDPAVTTAGDSRRC